MFFFFHALLSYIFFCCFHFRLLFFVVVVISFSQPHSSVWRNILEHNEIHFVLCELQQCVMKATIEIRIAVGLSNTTNQLHMHTTWAGDRSSRIYNTPTGHNGHPNLTRYKICNHCCLLLSTNKKLRFCSSARFMMLKMSSAEETNNKICQLRRDNHLLSVSRAVYAERYSVDFSSPPNHPPQLYHMAIICHKPSHIQYNSMSIVRRTTSDRFTELRINIGDLWCLFDCSVWRLVGNVCTAAMRYAWTVDSRQTSSWSNTCRTSYCFYIFLLVVFQVRHNNCLSNWV